VILLTKSTPPQAGQVVGLLDFFFADGMNYSWLRVVDHTATNLLTVRLRGRIIAPFSTYRSNSFTASP
jgi:hypothetical protein